MPAVSKGSEPRRGAEGPIPLGALTRFDDGSKAFFFYGPKKKGRNGWRLTVHVSGPEFETYNKFRATLRIPLKDRGNDAVDSVEFMGRGHNLKEVFKDLRAEITRTRSALRSLNF